LFDVGCDDGVGVLLGILFLVTSTLPLLNITFSFPSYFFSISLSLSSDCVSSPLSFYVDGAVFLDELVCFSSYELLKAFLAPPTG